MNYPSGPTRRVFLKTGGSALLAGSLPIITACNSPAGGNQATGNAPFMPVQPQTPDGTSTQRNRFLTDAERATLDAYVDRLIPADADPGALAGCSSDAIDHLLAAFQSDPPLIYAGAKFSDRGGNSVNEWLSFIPLDPYEELAWRISIEGSQGLPEREFNGPVVGMQQIYRDGLAALNAAAQAMWQTDFASAPAPARDQIISSNDPAIAELLDIAFPDTLEAFYGPPEYGGNKDLVGWSFTRYDGDVQPRGYTDEQVVNADNPGALDFLLPPSHHDPATRARPTMAKNSKTTGPSSLPMAPPADSMSGMIGAANGRLSRLRQLLKGTPHA